MMFCFSLNCTTLYIHPLHARLIQMLFTVTPVSYEMLVETLKFQLQMWLINLNQSQNPPKTSCLTTDEPLEEGAIFLG